MTTSKKKQPLLPFALDPSLLQLREHYPDSGLLASVAYAVNDRDRAAIVRLWLTEGIPYSFRDFPSLYEVARSWLGARLSLDPKHITVLGSARLGYSLAPAPDYGRPFGRQSDLDFSIISADLFAELVETFDRWKEDYGTASVHPRSDRERELWEDNLKVVPRGIQRGAIDPKKIPTWDRYPAPQRIATALWALSKKLEATVDRPIATWSTVRVYRDWESLAQIMANNLRVAARTLPKDARETQIATFRDNTPPMSAPMASEEHAACKAERERLARKLLEQMTLIALAEQQMLHYAQIVARDPSQASFIVGWTRRAFSNVTSAS